MITHLTIQIFKDDWSRSTAYQIINNTSLAPPPPVTPIKPPMTAGGATGGVAGIEGHLLRGTGPVPWTSTPYGSPMPGGHSHKH